MKVKSIQSPGKYIQASGILGQLKDYVKNLGESFLIVSDSFVFDYVKLKISRSFENNTMKVVYEKFGGECTEREIQRLIEISNREGTEAIIAIGGGKTLDTAKAMGYYTDLPVVIMPTLASSDAPCTALAVIYKENGEFDKYLYLSHNPDDVIVDIDIILNAPAKFLSAGIGDALSTYYEARACHKSKALNLVGSNMTNASMALAELCRDILMRDGANAIKANEKHILDESFENVVEANIYLSGVGAESSGLAAAHAINNGLTLLPELKSVPHGVKVGFGILVQLVLEGTPETHIKETMRFMREVRLPVTLQEMGLKDFTVDSIMKVAKASCMASDTMGNMPFDIRAKDVYDSIVEVNNVAFCSREKEHLLCKK